MSDIITSSSYFNPDGCDIRNEKLLLSTPTGFLNFNESAYTFADNAYNNMIKSFWTMEEVNVSQEGKAVKLLDYNSRQMYKHVFAQLSFNDSIQAMSLMDFTRNITNTNVRAALIKQAETEVLHSKSYATLLQESGNSEDVFNLYKESAIVNNKNKAIADMYARHINGRTSEDMLLDAVVNVCLEGIFFHVGFGFIYAIGDKVQGARDTIVFIHRDERIHCSLFSGIVKGIGRENNLFSATTINKINSLIAEAVMIEKTYAKELLMLYPIIEISIQEVMDSVNNFANNRLTSIGLEPIYPVLQPNSFEKRVIQGSNPNDTKTNFFEGNVSNYAKGSIDLDDF